MKALTRTMWTCGPSNSPGRATPIPTTLWQFGAQCHQRQMARQPPSTAPKRSPPIQYWHDLMYKYYVAPPAVPGKMWAGDLYKINRLVFMWEGTWTRASCMTTRMLPR